MSFLKMNTSNEIETFLKILVEESIKASKNQLLNEDDKEQAAYIKKMAQDKKRFNFMSEQEEDEVAAEEEVEVEEEPAQEEEPSETEVDVDVDVKEKETDADEGEVEANYFTIRDEINNIRSGNSLKATKVRQNLEQYVDRLDDNERSVLLTYLQAVSDIMHNEKTGSEAQDPSDDPISLSVTASAEEEEPEKATDEDEIEDTSPPVKVGEKQMTESIRKKVLQLMNC